MEATTEISAPKAAAVHQVRGAPVFFMHIAKTAGSYLNAVLKEALGPERVATHVEHRLGSRADLDALLAEGRQVISGHVMNGLWGQIAGGTAPALRKVTILRDPIAHLASHLLWLDHYNRPDRRDAYCRLDEAHQRVVDRIGAADLSNVGHLDHLLTHPGATEMRLFDNCQARYFLSSGGRGPDAVRPLTLDDARALRRAAEGFDLILRQDRLETGVAALGALIGVDLTASDARINEGQSLRRIDISNPLVRQVLSKRTLLDQWLWRWAGERAA